MIAPWVCRRAPALVPDQPQWGPAGSHLRHQVVCDAVGGSRKALRGLLSRRGDRGDRCVLAKLKPAQIFATVCPPGKAFSCPWHVDQDTVLGSSIVVTRGTNKNNVVIQDAGGREHKIGDAEKRPASGSCAQAPQPNPRGPLAPVVWF